MPVDENYDITKAELKDVDSYIRINGVQIVPLHYQQEGVYKPLYSLEIFPGNTYELFGKANGKSFYSKTVVPQLPLISNASRESDYLQALVNTHPGEVYAAAWIVYLPNNQINISPVFQEIVSPIKDNPDLKVSIRTTEIPEKYLVNPYSNNTYIQVYAFDEAYLEYFKSKDNNQPGNNAFLQGGGAIAWNVYGDDVIGLFIGRANGRQVNVN